MPPAPNTLHQPHLPSGLVWLDRLCSRSLRLLLLDVHVALQPRPWLTEEEVDNCNELCPRGRGESRLPAGEHGDAAPGDMDTPTLLAPLGDEDRMAGEGVQLLERDCYIRVGKGRKDGRPERRKGRKDG
ncbi:hypothetical protein B0H14DRAFT_3478609 [Mycena olivaceomarginata]|nr:hypothetical protein B0H14DRAFT_3478609 [Mycena olivaceomarginata]